MRSEITEFELDVGFFQCLLQALDVARPFARQLLARAQQPALLLRLSVRHKARADKPVSEQVRQPCGVVHVRLSPWDVFDMRRVGQNQLEIAIAQDVPDRLPVDAGCLHRDVGCAERSEPIRQGEQFARRGLEGAHLPDDFTRGHAAATGNNSILVNIQARAVGMQYVHEHPPGAPPAWNFRVKNSRKHAPGSLRPFGKLRGARKSPIQLSKGLRCTKKTPISPPAALADTLSQTLNRFITWGRRRR